MVVILFRMMDFEPCHGTPTHRQSAHIARLADFFLKKPPLMSRAPDWNSHVQWEIESEGRMHLVNTNP